MCLGKLENLLESSHHQVCLIRSCLQNAPLYCLGLNRAAGRVSCQLSELFTSAPPAMSGPTSPSHVHQ